MIIISQIETYYQNMRSFQMAIYFCIEIFNYIDKDNSLITNKKYHKIFLFLSKNHHKK